MFLYKQTESLVFKRVTEQSGSINSLYNVQFRPFTGKSALHCTMRIEFVTASRKISSCERKCRGSEGRVFIQNESKLGNENGVHLQHSPRPGGWWAAWHMCAGFPRSAYKHVDLHIVHILCGHILSKSKGSAKKKVGSSLVTQKYVTWPTWGEKRPETEWHLELFLQEFWINIHLKYSKQGWFYGSSIFSLWFYGTLWTNSKKNIQNLSIKV